MRRRPWRSPHGMPWQGRGKCANTRLPRSIPPYCEYSESIFRFCAHGRRQCAMATHWWEPAHHSTYVRPCDRRQFLGAAPSSNDATDSQASFCSTKYSMSRSCCASRSAASQCRIGEREGQERSRRHRGPPTHWHRLVHRTKCRHTDEKEGRPRLGGESQESQSPDHEAHRHQRIL